MWVDRTREGLALESQCRQLGECQCTLSSLNPQRGVQVLPVGQQVEAHQHGTPDVHKCSSIEHQHWYLLLDGIHHLIWSSLL